MHLKDVQQSFGRVPYLHLHQLIHTDEFSCICKICNTTIREIHNAKEVLCISISVYQRSIMYFSNSNIDYMTDMNDYSTFGVMSLQIITFSCFFTEQ